MSRHLLHLCLLPRMLPFDARSWALLLFTSSLLPRVATKQKLQSPLLALARFGMRVGRNWFIWFRMNSLWPVNWKTQVKWYERIGILMASVSLIRLVNPLWFVLCVSFLIGGCGRVSGGNGSNDTPK